MACPCCLPVPSTRADFGVEISQQTRRTPGVRSMLASHCCQVSVDICKVSMYYIQHVLFQFSRFAPAHAGQVLFFRRCSCEPILFFACCAYLMCGEVEPH